MTFSDLGLSSKLLRVLEERSYQNPTPIQVQAIPEILKGNDILASSQTGTGKTASFALPVLQTLLNNLGTDKTKGIKVLIITPTRELASQVQQSISLYAKYVPLSAKAIFGGVSIAPQITLLRKGTDILVATPGRLLDHIQRGTVNLSNLQTLILDEADRMLDMGFIHDIKRIIKETPDKKQALMFSATFAPEIRKLAANLLKKPTTIDVAPRNTAAETVKQTVLPVENSQKSAILKHIISKNNWSQVLVFTRTKHGANKLTSELERDGLKSAAIHGNKSQNARKKALENFKNGSIQVLVATDIASRGLDIEKLPCVINYDLPKVAEDYVHRIGRTGRAGQVGESISLISVADRSLLRGIERLLKKTIPCSVIEGFTQSPRSERPPVKKYQRPMNRPNKTSTAMHP